MLGGTSIEKKKIVRYFNKERRKRNLFSNIEKVNILNWTNYKEKIDILNGTERRILFYSISIK